MARFANTLLLVAVLAGSCGSEAPVIEGVWTYDSFDGTPVVVGENASEFPSFRFSDGIMTANAGCNQILSDYAFDGETLTFAGGEINEAECVGAEDDGAVMASERGYLVVTRAAEDGIDVTIEARLMTWTTPAGELTFLLTRRSP